jgi:hypothetical protein
MTAVTERPRLNRLVLSRPGKRIVVLFIVLGVLALAGTTTVGVINGARATHTAHKLDSAHAEVLAAYQAFVADSQACASQLACLHEADAKLAAALEHFRQELAGLTFPPQALTDAEQVEADVRDQIALVNQLAAAPAAVYNQMLARLQVLANQFNQDYQTLREQLPG